MTTEQISAAIGHIVNASLYIDNHYALPNTKMEREVDLMPYGLDLITAAIYMLRETSIEIEQRLTYAEALSKRKILKRTNISIEALRSKDFMIIFPGTLDLIEKLNIPDGMNEDVWLVSQSLEICMLHTFTCVARLSGMQYRGVDATATKKVWRSRVLRDLIYKCSGHYPDLLIWNIATPLVNDIQTSTITGI